MKQTLSIGVALTLASMLVACGSESTGTATNNSGTDTSTANTDASAADAASNDDASAADSGSAADTTTGTADTGATSDAGGGSSTNNCEPGDTQCIGTCSQAQCETEFGTCAADTGCAALIQCLSGCQNGVNPPEPASGATLPNGQAPVTCPEKCYANAGADATAKQQDIVFCSIGKCVKEVPGKTVNCPSSDNQCLNNCIAIKCMDPYKACDSEPKCVGLLTCLGKCPQGDAACQQTCATQAGQAGFTRFQNLATCMQSFCISQ